MLDLPVHVAAQRCERAAAVRLLIVAGRSYEFANDLVQEVLYATHAGTGTGRPPPHGPPTCSPVRPRPSAGMPLRSRTGRGRPRALLLAGEQAMRRSATSDAEALLGRALQFAERAGAAELIARAYLMRGQAREALGALPAGRRRSPGGAGHRAGSR